MEATHSQHQQHGHPAAPEKHDHQGHSGHEGHGGHHDHVAMFRRLFWISVVLAIPTVLLSRAFAHLVGYDLPDSPVIAWIPAILGTVLYVWGGRPFLTGAVDEVKQRSPGMMTLIALGITVAFLASWGSHLGLLDPQLEFWWELAMLVVIMLLGHWVEMASLARTSSALDELAALLPDEAELLQGDGLSLIHI